MVVHKSPVLRPLLLRLMGIAALVGLMALLIISDGGALGLIHGPVAVRPTGKQAPTPTPTPTPPPPLVYLMAHGNPKLHEIALTFDDGPAPTYTNAVLGVLQRFHIQATFFMLGIWVQRYPDLARAVVAAGNAVGDHSWNHPDLDTMSASQIVRQIRNTRDIIQQVTGVTPYIFRPPYGDYDLQVLNTAHQLNLSPILWNVDPRDWARPGVSAITNNILTFTQNGSIILMHDGGGDRSQTVAALPIIIEHLLARGFTFVTIPQMLRHLTSNDDDNPPGHPAFAGSAAATFYQPLASLEASLREPFGAEPERWR